MWSSLDVSDWTLSVDNLPGTFVAFVVAASALGRDSRDGNDWGRHPRP
jgi:hypothetical protein